MNRSVLTKMSSSTTEPELILSICWESGYLSAAFFNSETMELSVMQQTIEIRPEFVNLNNLFRIVTPTNILMAGHDNFLKEVLRINNIPPDVELKSLKVDKKGVNFSSNILIYPMDKKTLFANKNRVLKINLPGMLKNQTDDERIYFLESVLPIKEDLTVQTIGNLFQYLDKNWRMIYNQSDLNPVIVDLNVFCMQGQLLMDSVTFDALQIFTSSNHPSGFKKGAAGTFIEGFSIYGLLNKCSSKNGSNELKIMLKQPIRDLLELNLRHSTIDWLRNGRNFEIIERIKTNIKKIKNVNLIFSRLFSNSGKPNDWKVLKQTIYHAFLLCKLCLELSENDSMIIQFIKDFADIIKNNTNLELIVQTIDEIVNLEETEKNNRFIVNSGIDHSLDEKKRQIIEIQTKIQEDSSILELPNFITTVNVLHMPGYGFLIVIDSWDELPDPKSIESETLRFVFNANEKFYYKSCYCDQLDIEYGDLYGEIIAHENRICSRLIIFLKEKLLDIQAVVKLSGKFDCLIAMAQVSEERKYVKPEITTDKILSIKNGRHALYEINHEFTANDTEISQENKNLITILTAPNAAGKSVYMKHVALIAYLAHTGCHVPASSAKIGLLDAIFSRIYIAESTYQDSSSFLTDLQQMSRVMMNSTTKSLILIDEFGKGTTSNDGCALLTACLESLAGRKELAPLTIVITHFSNVYDLMKDKEVVSLKTIEVNEAQNGLVSTFKIKDGRSQTKYASNVPELKKFIDDIVQNNFE